MESCFTVHNLLPFLWLMLVKRIISKLDIIHSTLCHVKPLWISHSIRPTVLHIRMNWFYSVAITFYINSITYFIWIRLEKMDTFSVFKTHFNPFGTCTAAIFPSIFFLLMRLFTPAFLEHSLYWTFYNALQKSGQNEEKKQPLFINFTSRVSHIIMDFIFHNNRMPQCKPLHLRALNAW